MARRQFNRLRATQVRKLPAGKHVDGNGLMLVVQRSGSRSWVQRIMVHGKRIDIGIGSADLVKLPEAREAAIDNRRLARQGKDPRAAKVPTLAECARRYVSEQAGHGKWKDGGKVIAATLERDVIPAIGNVPVNRLGALNVKDAVIPLAKAGKVASARKAGHCISQVLEFATANEYRDRPNPVGDVLKNLPARRVATKHHDYVAWQDAPATLAAIRASSSTQAVRDAMEQIVLTAARTVEVRMMRWQDIDGRVWTRPVGAMKMKRAHRIPLSRQALAIIGRQPRRSEFVFCGATGKPLGRRTFRALVDQNNIAGTVHGWRTTFTEYVRENMPDVSKEVRDVCLAHAVGNQVDAAYNQGDLLDARRPVVQAWADYVTDSPVAGTLDRWLT